MQTSEELPDLIDFSSFSFVQQPNWGGGESFALIWNTYDGHYLAVH